MILGKNAQNVQKITDLIKENPRTTLLELEQDTGISKTTIGRIVTKDLKLKKTPAKFIPIFLTNEQKLCRLATCENMLEITRTDPEWKDKIITGDETWVYDYDPETKRQYAEWRGQDIAPNDFFLFPKLKAVLKGRHFDTRDDIIEKSLLALKNIPKELYKNCFDNLGKRWRWSQDITDSPVTKSRQDSGRQGTSKQVDHCLYRKMEQGREEDPKEPMESDPDSESGGSPTFPKKETTFGKTQEIVPGQEDVTPPPPVSDVLGRLTRTPHQLSAVTGHRERWNRYDGSYKAQSFFTNYDAQADRAQLQYSTRLRKPENLLQAPLRVTNTRADEELMPGRRRTKLRGVLQASCCLKRSDCCLPPVYFLEDSRRFYQLLSPVLFLLSLTVLQLSSLFTVTVEAHDTVLQGSPLLVLLHGKEGAIAPLVSHISEFPVHSYRSGSRHHTTG
ncbi:hypothetical protein LAZ67_1003367 [Cordylochernes scorpioides]|uniref:Uncharacterized protein n=1 Tax=Cordylochernes scorpioides TaxID=51811 RepID=A0ABY6JWT5_9ARAC|nr:hypothetical protein LAZ67_1003367 [Cordylochernes scorpioides]